MSVRAAMLVAAVLMSVACQPTRTPAPARQAGSLRIAFGSCADQRLPQPIWDAVAAQQPDLFLFIGDVVYADSVDPDVVAATFQEAANIEPFARFRQRVPILAVWDDHDYGLNDGGAEHPNKAAVQELFLQFFEEPADSPRWNREGLYHAWTRQVGGARVQIIFLDTRYHRSPLKHRTLLGKKLYIANNDPAATMLGDEQWRWLETELDRPADMRLLVSTIQALPDNHPFEKWANLPRERQRLLDLLAQPRDGMLLIASGDQHLGEISVLPREAGDDLVEITSSGMTHTRGSLPAFNRYRVGPKVLDTNFGLIDIRADADEINVDLRVLDDEGATRVMRSLKATTQRSAPGD